jgi:hypothetical protein
MASRHPLAFGRSQRLANHAKRRCEQDRRDGKANGQQGLDRESSRPGGDLPQDHYGSELGRRRQDETDPQEVDANP